MRISPGRPPRIGPDRQILVPGVLGTHRLRKPVIWGRSARPTTDSVHAEWSGTAGEGPVSPPKTPLARIWRGTGPHLRNGVLADRGAGNEDFPGGERGSPSRARVGRRFPRR